MIALACEIAFALLAVSAVLVLVRTLRGPTLPDRILGLDTLTTLAAAAIGVFAAYTRIYAFADIAVVVVLLGFLATAAFARFILSNSEK